MSVGSGKGRGTRQSFVRKQSTARAVAKALEPLETRRLFSAPNGPFALTATPDSISGAINLRVIDNATDETGFVFERTAGDGNFVQIAQFPDAAGTGQGVAYTDSNVGSGVTYSYRVFAVKGSTPSGIAGPVAATAPTSHLVSVSPDGPYGITAAPDSTGAVQVSFVGKTPRVSAFVLERAVNGGAFSTLATIPPASAALQTVRYTDATVLPGTTYQYRAYAVNGSVPTSITGPVTVTTPDTGPLTTPPTVPTASIATTREIHVSFVDQSTDESQFVLERSTDGGPYATLFSLPAVPGTGTTINTADQTVSPGHAYDYRVRAQAGTPGSGGVSASVHVADPGGISGVTPDGPFAIDAHFLPNNSIQVSFFGKTSGVTRFVLERSVNGEDFFFRTDVIPVGGPVQQFTYADPAPLPGSTYQYRVYALNGARQSSTSGPVTVVTPPATPAINPGGAPNGPFGLTAVARPDFTPGVDLSFYDNADNETGFVVERADLAAGVFSTVATIPASPGTHQVVSYEDTGIVGGAEYAYRVTAVNGTLASSVAGPATVATVSNLTATFTQPDGKQVVAGRVAGPSILAPVAIFRRNTDGGIDPSFGVVTIAPNPGIVFSAVDSLRLLPDGTVVALVTASGTGNIPAFDTRLALISPTGQLLKTVTVEPGDPNLPAILVAPEALAVGPTGKIYLAAEYFTRYTGNPSYPLVVFAFNSDLTPDTTFATSGRLQIPLAKTGGTSQATIVSLDVLPGGNLSLAYQDPVGGNHSLLFGDTGAIF